MGLAWGYLEKLSLFAHRGSGTRQAAAAAAKLQEWLKAMGYEVTVQRFSAPLDTLYLGPAAVMAGFLLGAAVGVYQPWLGVGICATMLIPMVGEMLGGRVDFDVLLPRLPSCNVVARRPSAAGVRRTLVIAGHYDTQRASHLFHPAFAAFLQTYFYLVYASLLAIPGGLAVRWALPGRPWPDWLLAAGVVLTAVNAAFLLVCRLTGRHTNGANDNGSGTALVLALAERMAHEPLPGADVIFVLTGSEEVGTRGMKHFVRHVTLDRTHTYFINLDNLGKGVLHYLTGEGMLKYCPYSPVLLGLAREVAAEHSRRVAARRSLLLPTDGLIPALSGYEAITFLAFLENGRLPNYHWHTDTLENADREFLQFAEEFLWQYVRRLCRSSRQG